MPKDCKYQLTFRQDQAWKHMISDQRLALLYGG